MTFAIVLGQASECHVDLNFGAIMGVDSGRERFTDDSFEEINGLGW